MLSSVILLSYYVGLIQAIILLILAMSLFYSSQTDTKQFAKVLFSFLVSLKGILVTNKKVINMFDLIFILLPFNIFSRGTVASKQIVSENGMNLKYAVQKHICSPVPLEQSFLFPFYIIFFYVILEMLRRLHINKYFLTSWFQ